MPCWGELPEHRQRCAAMPGARGGRVLVPPRRGAPCGVCPPCRVCLPCRARAGGVPSPAWAPLSVLPPGLPPRSIASLADKRVEYNPDSGLNAKLALYRGDITILDTDAVVNAANELLWAGGGICGEPKPPPARPRGGREHSRVAGG